MDSSKSKILPKKKQDVIDQENQDLIQEFNSANTNIEFETPKDMKNQKHLQPIGKVL